MSRRLAADVNDVMIAFVRELCAIAFQGFPALRERCMSALLQVTADALLSARNDVAEAVAVESEQYTQNHYYADTIAKVCV